MPAEGAAARAAAVAAAARRRRRLETALPWLVMTGLFLAWEIGCRAFAVPAFLLPAPSAIAESALKWWRPLLQDGLQTLFTTAVGFGLAIVAGLLLGVAIGSSALVYRGLYPLLIGFNSIPKVAVVPLLDIWIGTGSPPAPIPALSYTFFPILG